MSNIQDLKKMAANTLVSLRMANGMGEASTSGPKANGGFHSMKG